jgi:hypothetical protein
MRSMRTAGPSEAKIQGWAISRAYMITRLRWIAEMQMKYHTDLADEEDFDNVGYTTKVDHKRDAEILKEELSNPAHIEIVRSAQRPTAVVLGPPTGPDEARGLLLSDLLGPDDKSIAADLDRIETELRRLRSELSECNES